MNNVQKAGFGVAFYHKIDWHTAYGGGKKGVSTVAALGNDKP